MLRTVLTLLLYLLSYTTLTAQAIRISGKVTNEKNEPVAGASVKKINGAGTTTDLEGRFTISVLRGDSVEISAIGYSTKYISDFDAGEFNIVLQVAAKNLSDVTVTASR